MDFYADSPYKTAMEFIQKLEFPGHLRDLQGYVGNRMEYLKLGVFWKILARMGEYVFQPLLNCSNFSCRSASNGDEDEGKRERNPISSEVQVPSHLALVSSFVPLRAPTLKQTPGKELKDAWPLNVKAFSSNSWKLWTQSKI